MSSDENTFLQDCNSYAEPAANIAGNVAAGVIGGGMTAAAAVGLETPAGWVVAAEAGAAIGTASGIAHDVVHDQVQANWPDVCQGINDNFIDDRAPPAPSFDLGSSSTDYSAPSASADNSGSGPGSTSSDGSS